MLSYDKGTNTLTWNTGEEIIFAVRKQNVGTVTAPSVDLYKTSTTTITGTYTSGGASVVMDGTTMVFTTPKFLNTLPPGQYKLHLKGTVDSLVKDLHTFNLVVLKRNA